MLAARVCRTVKDDGSPCGAPPLRESDHCFVHDPSTAEQAAEARRLGGVRRRREGTLGGAYEFEGLRTPRDLIRLLEISAFDALALDNSVARASVIVRLVAAGARLFEVTDLADRIAALESVMEPRKQGKKR
jgi:hypothetical protein